MNEGSNRYVRDLLCMKYGRCCMMCKCRFSTKKKRRKMTYHHIKKLADGGETTVENGALLCLDCHKHLHSTPERETYYNKIIRKYKAEKDKGH